MAPRSTRVAPEAQARSPARSFAQSLDDFYAPSRDRRGEQAFQEGAQAFSGILGAQADKAKNEQRNNEHTQGIQDAMREQAGQELKGVQTGSLFRQNSSYYMMGLNETRGKAAASKFKSDLTQRYQDWEGRHIDDDGSAFREWMNGQVSEFMGGLGENQYMVAGALPTINEVANNFAVQHTAFTSARLEQESFEAYDEIVSGVFSDLSNGDIDMEGAVDRIAQEADDMYTTDGAKANDRVVEAAIRYANIHNDPDSILTLAKAHDTGKLKLSQVNRERLANAMDAVEADIARNTSKKSAQTTAEEKARQKAHLDGWAATLNDDPYADLPPFSEVGDAETWKKMSQLQEALITSGKVENPEITNQQRINFEARMADATNAGERIAVLNEFVQGNPNALSGADVSRYMQDIIAKEDPSSLVNDPLVKQYRTGFGEMLGQFQTDTFSMEQVSLLKTMGQRYFDDYMLRSAGNVDMSDPNAVAEVIDKAEAYSVKALTKQFPNMMRESMANEGAQGAAGGALGVPQAIEQDDAERAAEAAAVYEGLANGDADGAQAQDTLDAEPTVTPETPDLVTQGVEAVTDALNLAGPEVPVIDQEAPVVEPEVDIEPVLQDVEFTDDNLPVRGGMYGEMIQRFTDGQDTRHNLRSATEVMDSDPEFASAVDALGAELNIDPMAIMAVMDFESGFDPAIKNMAGSGATGLIQFMPSTARSLGTTTQALGQMTRAQQMPYVRRYFKQFGSRLSGGNVDDIYMAVLWPKAIGKPESYPIFRKGTIAYTQNKGLDTNGDGVVTKYEAASKVSRKFYGY